MPLSRLKAHLEGLAEAVLPRRRRDHRRGLAQTRRPAEMITGMRIGSRRPGRCGLWKSKIFQGNGGSSPRSCNRLFTIEATYEKDAT
jgi:hypothetical protein